MSTYRLAIGTHDPSVLSAVSEIDAVRIAAGYIAVQHPDALKNNPQEVVTLMGPDGLVTRPSERIDEFMHRAGAPDLAADTLQPGDANTPDCNGD